MASKEKNCPFGGGFYVGKKRIILFLSKENCVFKNILSTIFGVPPSEKMNI